MVCPFSFLDFKTRKQAILLPNSCSVRNVAAKFGATPTLNVTKNLRISIGFLFQLMVDEGFDAAVAINSSTSFAVNGNMEIRNVASHSSFELSKMVHAWVDNKSCREYEDELDMFSGPDFKIAALKHGTRDIFSLPVNDDLSMELNSHGFELGKTAGKINYDGAGYTGTATDELSIPKPLKRYIDDCLEPPSKCQRSFNGGTVFGLYFDTSSPQDIVTISQP